jgi:hypothetical protein
VLRLVRVAIGGLRALDPAALPAGAARPLTAAELATAYDATRLPGPPPAVFPLPCAAVVVGGGCRDGVQVLAVAELERRVQLVLADPAPHEQHRQQLPHH